MYLNNSLKVNIFFSSFQFPMGPGPDGPMGPMGPDMGPPVLNGINSGNKKFIIILIFNCRYNYYFHISNSI